MPWTSRFYPFRPPHLHQPPAFIHRRPRAENHVTGRQGPDLKTPITHYVDRSISDMLKRLDRYTKLRARDLVEKGETGSLPNMVRKIFSRFWKCYVLRRGYRENGYGFVIALCAALYPVLSHLKATLELKE